MIYGTAFFLSVVAALGVISSTLCAPALPAIAEYFGTKISEVQFTMSLFLIGNAFGQLASGLLSDVYGQRKVLLVALSLYIVASFSAGVAGSMGFLILCRFFQGMGSSVGPVLARAIAASSFDPLLSAKVQSYGAIGVGIASIMAILCTGHMTLISWRGNFFLAAGLGIILVFFAAKTLEARVEKTAPIPFKLLLSRLKNVIIHPGFIRPALCHSMTYGLMYGYIALFPFFVFDFFEKSPLLVAKYSAFMIVCYMLGAFGAARSVGHFSINSLIRAGLFLQITAGAILLLAPSKILFLCALVLFNIGIGLILPMTASSALSPFVGSSVGAASSTLGLSYRFLGSWVSIAICQLPLSGGRGLGGALILLSLLSLLSYVPFHRSAPITKKAQ